MEAVITDAEAGRELKELLDEVAEIDLKLKELAKPLNERKEQIKESIRRLRERFPSLFEQKTGQTVSAEGSGVTVNVTQPQTPVFVDWKALIERIGVELFHEVFTVTDADMDKKAWDAAVNEERASENDLTECLREGKKPTARVSFKTL